MASLSEVKQACNTAKEFYEEKKELITKAYNCCTINRCIKVKESVDSLKSNINSLKSKISGWSDSAGSSFELGITSCIDILTTVSSSIESAWTNAENLYEANYQALDDLKITIDSLEEKISNYPDRNDDKFYDSHYNQDTGEYEKKFNHSRYEFEVNLWETSCDSLIKILNIIQEKITTNFSQLEAINGESISVLRNILTIETNEKRILELSPVLIPALGMEIFQGSKIIIDSELSLIKLINMCYKEQGSVAGVAFECSQVINNFIRKKGYEPITVTELANLMNTSWYGSDTREAFGYNNYRLEGKDPSEYIQVTTEVLNGNRVLPEYVWEHDQIPIVKESGITKIILNGQNVDKNNRNNYIKDQTEITNVAGAKYIFYAFPDGVKGTGDPFGYFEKDKIEYDLKNSKV